MHGIGNDFVMVDLVNNPIPESQLSSLATSICDRRTGIGADGLITADFNDEDVLRMRMFNPDGSESEMCGNGVRCFAHFVQSQKLTALKSIPVETGAGILQLDILPNQRVKVDMGMASLNPSDLHMNTEAETWVNKSLSDTDFSITAVSMGNPHAVIFVDDLDAIDLAESGKLVEHHPLFKNRTNTHFVKVLSKKHIQIKTWERGAGATLACGTGACACAVASHLVHGTNPQVTVSLPGGDLEIEYQSNGRVLMTGPSTRVYEGVYCPQ